MKTSIPTTAEQVKAYCVRISADRLLVQGAGGNVSWKDGQVLWVKASGTWLADAEANDIFVPVDLAHLQKLIVAENLSATPITVGDSKLRPSIETMLHALLPHKVVVHLHAVEILAHLVRANPEESLKKLVGGAVKWAYVDYFKPGAFLAKAIVGQMKKVQDADVVFLRNHGVVIGGSDVEQIERILGQLLSLLLVEPSSYIYETQDTVIDMKLKARGYSLCDDQQINQLAINKELFSRLEGEWALYPDHVVFLGEEASIVRSPYDLRELKDVALPDLPFVFVVGIGVYASSSVTKAHKAQLRCYYDVLVRQCGSERLNVLNKGQIAELLNWDAEKYRRNTSGTKTTDH